MNSHELKTFLCKSKKAGYASGGESVVTREEDGSKSTRYKEGEFAFHDNYFGGEPFGGREVVHLQGKPYWMMVYYGSDSGEAPGLIPFLLKALSAVPEEMPLRGPTELTDGDFEYKNTWQGTVEQFSGEEKIFYNGKEVYYAKYVGGLVDQREDQ